MRVEKQQQNNKLEGCAFFKINKIDKILTGEKEGETLKFEIKYAILQSLSQNQINI